MFVASQPSFHFFYSFANSLRGRECRLWTCGLVGGLPLSIEDSAHNLRYPIQNGLLVSLASFPSLPWRLEVYYETQAVLCTSALLLARYAFGGGRKKFCYA